MEGEVTGKGVDEEEEDDDDDDEGNDKEKEGKDGSLELIGSSRIRCSRRFDPTSPWQRPPTAAASARTAAVGRAREAERVAREAPEAGTIGETTATAHGGAHVSSKGGWMSGCIPGTTPSSASD